MSVAALPPIIERYSQAVCHLNHAKDANRLGLILGSGISRELHLPLWKDLLTDLENALSYPHGDTVPESYRAEQLFQTFRARAAAALNWPERDNREAEVSSKWRAFVSARLYKGFLKSDGTTPDLDRYKKAIADHPYMMSLARIASELELVVSHNFDNALETAIDEDPSTRIKPGRRFNAFWKPEPFLRRGMVNVYHPNGYMPFARDVKGSDSVILTEAGFADHLANTNSAEAHFLLRHLAEKTWLIIGHSLADGTLKNALRMHANQRPGHISYYVHYAKNGASELTDEQQSAIREANFHAYNLVTIFASSAEIAELLNLVCMSKSELYDDCASHGVKSRYVYYIAGAVSSGKSTVLGHLRNLVTIEEWPGKMPVTMNKPSIELTLEEQREIDKKLEVAVWTKNREIDVTKVGVVVVDRSPLDFIAFPRTKTAAPTQTANERFATLFKRLHADDFAKLCAGQVILVTADPNVLLERQLQRGSRVRAEDVPNGDAMAYLKTQQNLMRAIYKQSVDDKSAVDADACSVAQTLKDVARIIHFEPYKPFNFKARLQEILAGTI